MELLLYTNINYLRDVLAGNAVVCRSACERERTPSLGIIASTKMFLTHKKIDKSLRFKGLDNSQNDGEVPVHFKLEILDEYRERIKVQLVKTSDDVLVDGTLADYDENSCEGCFWGPFIPAAYIKEIVFEKTEDTRLVFKPSPDLWYPESLYSLIYNDDYSESIDYDRIKSLLVESEEECIKAKHTVLDFEKKRAILYYALKMTESWIIGKYRFNVDPYIIKKFGFNPSDIAEKIHVDTKDLMPSEYSDALYSEGFNRDVSLALLKFFFEQDITTAFNKEKYEEIVSVILHKAESVKATSEHEYRYICSAIEHVRDNVFSVKGIPLKEVLESIAAVPPIKALACVLKYPHDFDKISGTLQQYDVGQETARLAAMFFAAIHGMEFLEGAEKNNLLLERLIDEIVLSENNGSIYSESEYKSIFSKDVSDILREIPFYCERIVDIEDIFEYFSQNIGKINILKIKKNYGKKIDWDKYMQYVVPKGCIPGTVLSRKQAEELSKRITTPVEKIEEFIDEYFKSLESFRTLYELKPDFWKSYYKESQNGKWQ